MALIIHSSTIRANKIFSFQKHETIQFHNICSHGLKVTYAIEYKKLKWTFLKKKKSYLGNRDYPKQRRVGFLSFKSII